MGQKVMIVDDSKTIRVQIKHVIKSQGYEIIEASNGAEAVELYRTHQDSVFMKRVLDQLPGGIVQIRQINTCYGRTKRGVDRRDGRFHANPPLRRSAPA